ncbi:LexA family protein [Larkinella bovis]|uniref:LexA family protein n=1 Tax=Larkinella bovis TaxID=683041 RepID=A0ABW0IBC6_9BACT
MIEQPDRIDPGEIYRLVPGERLQIPLYSSYVAAGFPNAAEHYIEKVIDANDLLIHNEEATYFVRVGGDSMSGDRIEPGDILVVDCSVKPTDGRIVVVILNGEHVCKRIHYAGRMVVLLSSNPKYDPIYVHEGEDFRVFGVVTRVIMKTL